MLESSFHRLRYHPVFASKTRKYPNPLQILSNSTGFTYEFPWSASTFFVDLENSEHSDVYIFLKEIDPKVSIEKNQRNRTKTRDSSHLNVKILIFEHFSAEKINFNRFFRTDPELGA